MARRLLLVGAVITALLGIAVPASGKGRTLFVVSGGDLRRSVSFDSRPFERISGPLWHAESHVPYLTGWRYRLRMFDAGSPAGATEWIYVPDASGALPTEQATTRYRADDGPPVRWMAFSPAFNAALIGQIRASQDGQAVLMLGAIGIAMLLVLTTVGFRVDVVVRAVVRWLAREPRIPIVPDDGPSYLYTRVPRSLWVEAGRLGCVPTTPAGSR